MSHNVGEVAGRADAPSIMSVPSRSLLARQVLDRVIAEVPYYRMLPQELLRSDASGIVSANVGAFLNALATGKAPRPETFAHAAESARQRAEEGVPLPDLLSAYACGVRALWDGLNACDKASDSMVTRAAAILFETLEVAISTVSAAYLTGYDTVTQGQRDAQHSMITAMIEGRGAEAAAALGLELAECYLVASLAFGQHPDEVAAGLDTAVATRRKIRRIRDALYLHGNEGTFTSVTATGGLALIPQAHWTGSEQDWKRVDGLLRRVEIDAAVPVVAAVDVAAHNQVAAVIAETGEILAVVEDFNHPPGTYRLQDVLVEYQLTRPSAARTQLANLLTPLEANPTLLDTLDTFMRSGGNRQATARRLHLHPNSVDYRLRKVLQWTGLDATTFEGAQRITAALAARRSGSRRRSVV